jgi:hypothetical protein
MPLEVLYFLLMFFSCSKRCKSAQVPFLISLWIFLAGVKPVFAGFEFPDHISVYKEKTTIVPFATRRYRKAIAWMKRFIKPIA